MIIKSSDIGCVKQTGTQTPICCFTAQQVCLYCIFIKHGVTHQDTGRFLSGPQRVVYVVGPNKIMVVICQFWSQMNKLFAVARPQVVHSDCRRRKKANILVKTVVTLLVETLIKKISAISGNIESIYQKVGKFCPSHNVSLGKLT